MKEYLYNPTTVYIDPSTEMSVGLYETHRVKAVPISQYFDNGSPFDPSTGPDPSPGPTPDPSSWEYDEDGNGVPDIIDTLYDNQDAMQQQQDILQQNQTWSVI